jgi:sugar phosphate isomerase/epimerase
VHEQPVRGCTRIETDNGGLSGGRVLATPFRVGATSYVIEAGLAANARHLAGQAQDVQLVLFDLPGGPNNLPAPDEVAELARIGQETGLGYTVHLLDDICPGAPDHPSLRRAHMVIELTQPLAPWAYVLHLEGRAVRDVNTQAHTLAQWQGRQAAALRQLAGWAGDGRLLAVENLEGYPPEFVSPVVEALAATPHAVSRRVDVGHLWLDGHDPLPHLQRALPHLRVVHLHGADGTGDHQSLALMPPQRLDAVIHFLLDTLYAGVLTLEVFGRDAWESSRRALAESVARYAPAS